jgi:hypothetical protein
MKLCKDCAHISHEQHGRAAICRLGEVSLVDGTYLETCFSMRQDGRPCGPDGNLWCDAAVDRINQSFLTPAIPVPPSAYWWDKIRMVQVTKRTAFDEMVDRLAVEAGFCVFGHGRITKTVAGHFDNDDIDVDQELRAFAVLLREALWGQGAQAPE